MTQPRPGSEPSSRPALIDPYDEGDMRHWAEKLSVTVEQLREAVAQAGPRPEQVGEYLLRMRADDHRVP
ncbi:DUF3606 domain-containing protein [Caldimonas brevitalea]|uniref:DUF3606 domain-containing protein n=1 Tax=Caldimonas brevitalea TaxID=413882 RepID=A0A0G3BFH6_9BURK|nr:DUF3606 domain-containing protein [Caldimonas brevitalea]AKJ26723.1 hypothetical protein AAW51_0032 [Caldimonas brevitalea]